VIDDDRRCGQAGEKRRDHFLDTGVILEDQVDALRAPDGVRWCACDAGPERLELPGLVGRAVPHGDLVATLRGRFDEGAAEEAGAEKCDAGH
jgi:hypothetical protein